MSTRNFGLTPEERLAVHVDRSGGPDACWPWTGFLNNSGYGWLYVGGGRANPRLQEAHRLAHELATGMPIPNGLVVMHSCDNKVCCNPRHLSAGTQAQNVKDAAARGLMQRTITLDQVAELRRLFDAGMNSRELAQRFGIHISYVRKLGKRQAGPRSASADVLMAMVQARISELWRYRQWFRTHRWADWPEIRREHDIELRALVKLVRAALHETRMAQDFYAEVEPGHPEQADPITAAMGWHDWQAAGPR